MDSGHPINIVSGNFLYRPNDFYEIEVDTEPGVIQYLVILRMDLPCQDAVVEFVDYEDYDGKIILGSFCGTKFQWSK